MNYPSKTSYIKLKGLSSLVLPEGEGPEADKEYLFGIVCQRTDVKVSDLDGAKTYEMQYIKSAAIQEVGNAEVKIKVQNGRTPSQRLMHEINEWNYRRGTQPSKENYEQEMLIIISDYKNRNI